MGIVSVWPGKLPANVIVAPNSPRARAQHNTAPAPRDGATMGTVIRRNTAIRLAPSVAAASSKPWSADRNAPSTVMIRNGMATKVSASTQASGTPIAREIAVLADAVHTERMRAWVASDPLRAAPSRPHGARISRPAKGRIRKTTAISAGTSKGAGTDREAPPRAARLARSRAVRRDGAVRVTMAAPDASSGLLEPRGGEHLLARR